MDSEKYRTSVYADTEVKNLFADADINYFGYNLTYLSRSNWQDTYPEEKLTLTATEAIITGMSNYDYETPADAPSVNDFTQGANNNLQLVDMINVDYDDDETWNKFIDQLTVKELTNLMTDSISVEAVPRLGITGSAHIDDDTTTGGNLRWSCHVNLARTFDEELITRRGYLSGIICQLLGYDTLWYGTNNMHRTPFGGRANQYYSEDGNTSYQIGYYEAQGVQAAGVILCAKHSFANDQETFRSGISTFMTEQNLRETYARAFEGSFAGGALGTMTALNRIGIRLAKNNEAMLTGLFRGEWGWKGNVTSDGYVKAGFFDNTLEETAAGMDYSCLDSIGVNSARVKEAIDNGDGYILLKARESAKHNLYVMTKTWRMNGMDAGATVLNHVPAWQTALLAANFVTIIGFAVFAVLTVVSTYGKEKRR